MADRTSQREHRLPERLRTEYTRVSSSGDDDPDIAAAEEPLPARPEPIPAGSQLQRQVGPGRQANLGPQPPNTAKASTIECEVCGKMIGSSGIGSHRAGHARELLRRAAATAKDSIAAAYATAAATASASAASAAGAAAGAASAAAEGATASAAAARPCEATASITMAQADTAAPAPPLQPPARSVSNAHTMYAPVQNSTFNVIPRASSAATLRPVYAPNSIEFSFIGLTIKGTWNASCASFPAAIPTRGREWPTISDAYNTAAGLGHLNEHDCTKLQFTPPGQKEGSRFQVLSCDDDMKTLIEHAQALSEKSHYPQLPSLYACMRSAQPAAKFFSGSSKGGRGMGRGFDPRPAPAHKLILGSRMESYNSDAKSAILLAFPELEERLEEAQVLQAVNQWASQLTAKHNLLEAENARDYGVEEGGGFNTDLVDKTLPDFVLKKLQVANNIAAASQSSVSKLAARMLGKQTKSDFACTPGSARAAQALQASDFATPVQRSASESELYSPRQAHQLRMQPLAAQPSWTHKMKWSELTTVDVDGQKVPVQLNINQLLIFRDVSPDGTAFYMKFENGQGYASSYIPRASMQKLGSPTPIHQPPRIQVNSCRMCLNRNAVMHIM